MSCLDVMYPAYGRYAPYAPTAPAFISSLQVGSEQMFSVPMIFLLIYSVIGEMGVAEVKASLTYLALVYRSLCVKANKLMGKSFGVLCVCYVSIRLIKLVI